MRTPAGTECPHYYADFHRGRQKQACRLIEATPNGGRWTPDLCARCSVPRIILANACPNMVLHARVRRGLLGLRRSVEVTATCRHIQGPVEHPEIGCGHCHENRPTILVAGDTE
jgi:hypothetical protein